MSKKLFIKGTLLLTFAGLLSRLMGFFYRIFLSHTIGAHGLGIFQLILPLQILIMSICASGIQTAISRLTAAEKVSKNPSRHISDYFVVGTVFSVVFSLVFSWFLYSYADFWAVQILKESQTSSLIRILSLSIPLSTLHTCISSYYLGRKQAGFPAGVQLLEQLFRTGGCYILYLICASQGRNITPAIAVGGNLIGEIASSFISLFAVSMHFKVTHYNIRNIRRPLSVLRKLLHISVPLTMNKILLTLLGSIEVILIPARLQMSGLTPKDSLSVYGIFTDGTSAYSFPRYAYKLGCGHADSLHYPAADSGVSKANPICDRQDFPILSAARRILLGFFSVSWRISWKFSVSQSDSRNLYPYHVLYLSFSVPEHHSHQRTQRPWKIRHLPAAQCDQRLHPDQFRAVCNPCSGNPGISVRDPLQRTGAQHPAQFTDTAKQL